MMADNTKIEWTEATWNPVTGCSVVSPGCTNCYAMKLAGTRLRTHGSRAGLTRETKAGPVWTGEVRFNEQWLDQPLRWKRPRMIFVCAHGDLFHEDVPDLWIDRVFAVMALCPQHTFQVLTKRSARMRAYMTNLLALPPDDRIDRFDPLVCDITRSPCAVGCIEDVEELEHPAWLPNVWLGVSVEDQARADERIPDLLTTPAAVRWLSCEPLLGPVRLNRIGLQDHFGKDIWLDSLTGASCTGRPREADGGFIDNMTDVRLAWIVAGGESGPGARPMHPDWARSLRDQCAEAGVPFFFKQWGEFAPADGLPEGFACRGYHQWLPGSPTGGQAVVYAIGKKRAGRLLDGVTHDAIPERPS